MPGNQTATFSVSGRRLAEHLGMGFTTPIWWHLEVQEPLDEARIRAMVEHGEGLAPEPGRMGDALTTVADHEARIAWLVQSDDNDWTPLALSAGWREEGERVTAMLYDGHHRLLSTRIRERRITVEVVSGDRQGVDAMMDALDGEWLFCPQDRLFGRGVFPAPALGEEHYVEVSCAPDKIWINEVSQGVSVARYGTRLWNIEPFPLANESGYVAEIRSGGEALHRERFLKACETRLGVDKDRLARYCREVLC